MDVQILPNTLVFKGILDENCSLERLLTDMGKLKKAGAAPPINIDLSAVQYANSAGIVVWLKFLHQVGLAFKYINAPIWLVNQFNIITGFFDNGSFVESLHAPYFAPKSQDSRAFTLLMGKDIPVQEDYSALKMPNKTAEGKVYEIDFMPERYFSFIADNLQMFKEKIK